MDSLWPEFDNHIIEQNDAIQILRSQARAIKTQTKGIVNATFSKMNYKSGPTNALKSISQVIADMSSPCYEEVLDEELVDKSDVNLLYAITKYKFELYNTEYRFRLFILNYREMFPISLEVDGGVLEDIPYKNGEHISSNEELKNVLTDIFCSSKVRSVVTKMLDEGKRSEK